MCADGSTLAGSLKCVIYAACLYIGPPNPCHPVFFFSLDELARFKYNDGVVFTSIRVDHLCFLLQNYSASVHVTIMR